MNNDRAASRCDALRPLAYAGGALGAVIVPVVLWILDLPLILYSWGRYYQVFELFGLCGALWLGAVAFVEWRRLNGTFLDRLVLVGLPLAVCLHYLSFVADYSARSGDYLCYEAAAKAILDGANPYGKCYFYPPLAAQVMAALFRLGQAATLAVRRPVEDMHIWYVIFYVYQCAQFYLIALAYLLCCRVARRMGAQAHWASLTVAALLLFNNALVRTIRHNQVNLWVLDLELLALLLVVERPWLGGLAVALAGHIKVYPLLLLGPWALTRRWRAALGAVAGAAAIILAQLATGQGLALWMQYLTSPMYDPKAIVFRNNSLQSILYNSVRSLRYVIGRDLTDSPLVTALSIAATAAVVAWFAWRFWRREQSMGDRASGIETLCPLYGHMVDAMALALIISPSVWVHQYVLSLPVALWAAVRRWRDRPLWVLLGIGLMLAAPVFDVFPLSYHRIVGLVILLVLTAPDRGGERVNG